VPAVDDGQGIGPELLDTAFDGFRGSRTDRYENDHGGHTDQDAKHRER
jgi:hypothetical protein